MSKEEFNNLIEKYLSGHASSEEEKLIDDFFHVHDKNQTLQHYKLSEEMWSSIEDAVHETKFSTYKDHSAQAVITKPPRRNLHRILWTLAIAASISFAVVSNYLMDKPAPVSWVTSKVSNGQKSIITLTDGSRVYLNSASSISYPATFDGDKREIILTGEAFFEVTHDEKRPFIVRSGNISTRVLGTSFNINTYTSDQIRVAVATGKVQVEVIDHMEEKIITDPVFLTSNEQVTYSARQEALTISSVDISKIIAWKNQTLYFDGATLEDVAQQLERWYNVSIEFENDGIKNCTVNGQYKDQTIHDVLGSIRYMHQIEYTFNTQTKILLYGKGCSN